VARLALARPRLVLAVAALLAVLGGLLGRGLSHRLDPIGVDDPGSDSFKTRQAIKHATGLEPSAGLVVLVPTPRGVDTPGARAEVVRIVSILVPDPAVARVASVLSGGRHAFVSRDGKLTYVAAQFRAASDRTRQDAAKRLTARLTSVPGVKVGGVDVAYEQLNATIERDLRRIELVAFPILFALSLWFFRGLVAAALPVLLGGFAVMLTFLELRVATAFGSVSVAALNIVTALGLGLALDYSLLIVSRFREELARTNDHEAALRRTMRTAGRTVLFSAPTIAAVLASLFVFPQRYFYSMALGGACVALLVGVAALVFLPALLSLLGHRVNALAPARLQRSRRSVELPATDGRWYRFAKLVMRRPVAAAAVAASILIALAVPSLGMTVTSTDASTLPHDTSARQVDDAVRSRFSTDPSRAIQILATQASNRDLRAYGRRLASLPGVAQVAPPRRISGRLALFEVTPSRPAASPQTQQLVNSIRSLSTPFTAGVTGPTAVFLDLKDSLRRKLPAAAVLVVLASGLAIFLLTGSVVLPIKTLVMNCLSVGAALGILVLIFQHGRLQGLLGYESTGGVDIVQPVLLAAVALGLSIDYGVFLLDRIREARAGGLPDEEAIALGLERTGRIVTAAALLFCVAIAALVASEILGVKQVGLGTAAAVIIDATIVRALLVPALMRLLGARNWWSPVVLRRLYRVGGATGSAND
jgi:uncharacterized membrane protein YdfJ with MMPL/SSD domain